MTKEEADQFLKNNLHLENKQFRRTDGAIVSTSDFQVVTNGNNSFVACKVKNGDAFYADALEGFLKTHTLI